MRVPINSNSVGLNCVTSSTSGLVIETRETGFLALRIFERRGSRSKVRSVPINSPISSWALRWASADGLAAGPHTCGGGAPTT